MQNLFVLLGIPDIKIFEVRIGKRVFPQVIFSCSELACLVTGTALGFVGFHDSPVVVQSETTSFLPYKPYILPHPIEWINPTMAIPRFTIDTYVAFVMSLLFTVHVYAKIQIIVIAFVSKVGHPFVESSMLEKEAHGYIAG